MQCCGLHCRELVQERVQWRVGKNWFRIVLAGVNCIELGGSGTDLASAECSAAVCTRELVQERVQRRVGKNWFRIVLACVNCIEQDRVKVQRGSGTDLASAK
jgi:hypothetical protein